MNSPFFALFHSLGAFTINVDKGKGGWDFGLVYFKTYNQVNQLSISRDRCILSITPLSVDYSFLISEHQLARTNAFVLVQFLGVISGNLHYLTNIVLALDMHCNGSLQQKLSIAES